MKDKVGFLLIGVVLMLVGGVVREGGVYCIGILMVTMSIFIPKLWGDDDA